MKYNKEFAKKKRKKNKFTGIIKINWYKFREFNIFC